MRRQRARHGRNSYSFDRARSRPAKISKGKQKAAYYPKMRYSPQNSARRLAPFLFLPAASSCHEVLTVGGVAVQDKSRFRRGSGCSP
jgi:hypothetical protein